MKKQKGEDRWPLVHAETSTGVLQPLEGLNEIVARYGALLLVDAVTSLAGHPVEVDRHGIDACYAGTQKALSAPPGLAPITLSERAVEAMPEALAEGPELLPGRRPLRAVLGDEQVLPPHASRLVLLRPAGGPPDRRGGGTGRPASSGTA